MRASPLTGKIAGGLKGVWFARKGKFWFWVRSLERATVFSSATGPTAQECHEALRYGESWEKRTHLTGFVRKP